MQELNPDIEKIVSHGDNQNHGGRGHQCDQRLLGRESDVQLREGGEAAGLWFAQINHHRCQPVNKLNIISDIVR